MNTVCCCRLTLGSRDNVCGCFIGSSVADCDMLAYTQIVLLLENQGPADAVAGRRVMQSFAS